MTHTSKIISAIFIATLLSTNINAQNNNAQSNNSQKLEIVRGNVDTVYTTPHVIVGVTEPTNKPSINNENVHIYKTGAFGGEVKLNPGNNTIKVNVVSPIGEQINEELNVFYNTQPNLKAIKEAKEREEQAEIDSKIKDRKSVV